MMMGTGIYGTFNVGDFENIPQIYDLNATANFIDVNYSRGTTDAVGGPSGLNDKRYMRYSIGVDASDLSGISNRNLTTIRITSNKNQNIDYNSFKFYIKHNGSNLDITGLSPNLTLTNGTFSGWIARGNYYYIELQLDTPFVWDGISNMRFYYDFDVPNPSYSGANTSNYVAFISNPGLNNYYVCSASVLGNNPTSTYTWARKQINYLVFE